MAKAAAQVTVDSLLDKGNGVLVKRNGVWSYPGAPNDHSGTNLVLPIEFVSDAAVQDAITKGDLVTKATDVMGVTTAVTRAPAEGETVQIVNMAQAGSVEAATELPLNSRPTHDAGRNNEPVDAARAQAIIEPAKIPQPSGPIAPAAPVATTQAGASTAKA